jgi:hypothetical protein
MGCMRHMRALTFSTVASTEAALLAQRGSLMAMRSNKTAIIHAQIM